VDLVACNQTLLYDCVIVYGIGYCGISNGNVLDQQLMNVNVLILCGNNNYVTSVCKFNLFVASHKNPSLC
jgi:hypothetical protein